MTLTTNNPITPNNYELRLLFVLVVISLIIFSFSSCSIIKNKLSDKNKSDSSISITSQGYRKIEKDSTVETKTKVTESIDTTVTIKGDTISASKSINEVFGGDTLKASENGIITKIFKNVQGLLQVVTIVKDKKIVIKNTKVTESESKVVDKGKSLIKEKEEINSDVKKEKDHLTVETKTSYFNWWWLLLIIPIGLATWWGYRKFII